MIAISGTQYDCAKWLHVFGVVLIINNTQLPQAVMEEGFNNRRKKAHSSYHAGLLCNGCFLVNISES